MTKTLWCVFFGSQCTYFVAIKWPSIFCVLQTLLSACLLELAAKQLSWNKDIGLFCLEKYIVLLSTRLSFHIDDKHAAYFLISAR